MNDVRFVLNLFFCLGGILGAFMTGLFSQKWVNPTGGFDGAFYGRPIQLWYQIAGILTAIGK
jgi:ammonia channel protein AmtB